MKNQDEVVAALGELQRLVRKPSEPSESDLATAIWIGVENHDEAGEELSGQAAIGLLPDEAVAAKHQLDLLIADQRFEHLADPKREIERFITNCVRDRDHDHVKAFVEEHARTPTQKICYLPVVELAVTSEKEVFGIRLLPPDAAELPITPGPMFKSVAAVAVTGTDPQAMADRARAQAEQSLRRLRVALRQDLWIHAWQLRFRLAPPFAFDDGVSGSITPEDTSWELELTEELLRTAKAEPVSAIPTSAVTDLQRQANLALEWIEAAFSPDRVAAALNLFFALEAILGRKSDREKGHGLAFRRAVLSSAVSGGFTHPNRIYIFYDKLRSAAVHGEIPPDISLRDLQSLSWDVRRALNEALVFASERDIQTRKRLLRELDRHPERPKIVAWIRATGDPSWTKFLDALAGPQEQGLIAAVRGTVVGAWEWLSGLIK